jgi:hypothetical protein
LTGGVLGFAPSQTSKTIEFDTYLDSITEGNEFFEIRIDDDVTPEKNYATFPQGNTFRCTITEAATPLNPETPPTISPPSVPGTVIITTPIPVTPSYIATVDKPFVSEGEVVTFTITTTNVADGTVLSYTLNGTGVTEEDIVGGSLVGTATIFNNSASILVEIAVNDDTDEDENDFPEDLLFSVDNTTASALTTIVVEPVTIPFYSVTADRTGVNEGETITYTISTLNVADGTVLNYTLSGDGITLSDIVGESLTGSVTILSNSATTTVTITDDGIIEEAEILKFSIDSTDAFVEVIINPTFTVPPLLPPEPPILTPTFNISTDKLTYTEGENIIYTITTTNVPDGSVLSYSIFGDDVTPSDFILETLEGSFTINDNKATVIVGIADDTQIEGEETVTFSIDGTSAFADVIIEGNEIPSDRFVPPTSPCLKKPIASAITDEKGKLISIAIDDKGCPYAIKPEVIITGSGYGAAGIVLLDDKGFVSEVRLVRTGTDYKVNTPSETNLNCIIDSFTMLRPGSGYETAPTVYVNDNPNIAKAIVENGFVVSVEILDRTVKFDELPIVKIIGGGGYGAKFLPSLSCLETQELERRGYAKIGTGKYIDCP